MNPYRDDNDKLLRRVMLPFPTTCIAAGGAAEIQAKVLSHRFCPVWLVLPDPVSGYLLVERLALGSEEVILGGDNPPASEFGPRSLGALNGGMFSSLLQEDARYGIGDHILSSGERCLLRVVNAGAQMIVLHAALVGHR